MHPEIPLFFARITATAFAITNCTSIFSCGTRKQQEPCISSMRGRRPVRPVRMNSLTTFFYAECTQFLYNTQP